MAQTQMKSNKSKNFIMATATDAKLSVLTDILSGKVTLFAEPTLL